MLAAGNYMSIAEVIRHLIDYHVNVLTGDGSQVVQVVHHISTLPKEKRDLVKLDRIIYTSEVLTGAQRSHIRAVLGAVNICSILGSAEGGPWAVSNPKLTGSEADTSQADFVFDTRAMLVEILPPSFSEEGSNPDPISEGESGIIVQTSLSRLRNPVVRYITGDVGSLHPLPEHARAMVPEADWEHLKVLRLQGRDRRFSFDWDGSYLQFEDLTALMNSEECGVLQWQVILDKMEDNPASSLEIRLLCSSRNGLVLSEEEVIQRVRKFIYANPGNDSRLQIIFVKALDEFERSTTGRKVIKFIDRFN